MFTEFDALETVKPDKALVISLAGSNDNFVDPDGVMNTTPSG